MRKKYLKGIAIVCLLPTLPKPGSSGYVPSRPSLPDVALYMTDYPMEIS
jgi:hypothetical protein